MSNEGPKLFNSKPKKSKLKPSGMASSSSAGAAAAAPPPPPPPPPSPPVKEPIVRFRFYKTLAVVLSLTVGAYAFARTVLKVGSPQQEKPEESTASTSLSTTPASASATATASVITEQPVTPPTVEPVQRVSIPEDQQRELFKWILEEKRKTKPKDAAERKRIDEEKAILKQFIRAKTLPTI